MFNIKLKTIPLILSGDYYKMSGYPRVSLKTFKDFYKSVFKSRLPGFRSERGI